MTESVALREEDLLTRKEVSRRIGLCEKTLDGLVRDGLFPKPIRQGKRWLRFRLADVNAYIEGLDNDR